LLHSLSDHFYQGRAKLIGNFNVLISDLFAL